MGKKISEKEKNKFLRLWIFSFIGLCGLFIVGTLAPKGTESTETKGVSWEYYCNEGYTYFEHIDNDAFNGPVPACSRNANVQGAEMLWASYKIKVLVNNEGLNNVKSDISCVTDNDKPIGSGLEEEDCLLELSELGVSGDNFRGWDLNASCTNPNKDTISVNINTVADALHPCFKTRTAKFVGNKTTSKTCGVDNDGNCIVDLTQLEKPTKTGYVFGGWRRSGSEGEDTTLCLWETVNVPEVSATPQYVPCWFKAGNRPLLGGANSKKISWVGEVSSTQ